MTYLELQTAQRKQVEHLRTLTRDWCTYYNVTQSQLAKNVLHIAESYLSDFLGGKRNLSADNFLKLAAVVSKPADPNRGARLAHIQHFSVKESDCLDIDIENARAEFEAQRSAKIHADNQRRQVEL